MDFPSSSFLPKEMSVDMSSEHIYYVHCNFCNTILGVSVPCSSMMNKVTVKCGHCANLLFVNVGSGLLQCLPIHQQLQVEKVSTSHGEVTNGKDSSSNGLSSSSSKTKKFDPFEQSPQLIKRPSEKRQRLPSTYNRFIKEEIRRIKSNNPKITHREAFSTAAKNWAHFPSMHYGLDIQGDKQAK